MTTKMRWKNDAAFEADVRSSDEVRLRAIHDWAASGEAAASRNGRHNSPSVRREWKSLREAVEAEMLARGIEV